MRATVVRILSLSSCALVVASCGDSTAPISMPAAQVAEVLGEGSQAVSFGTSGFTAVGLLPGPAAGLPRGSCVWNEQFGGFDCPAQGAGGTTVTVSFQLLDGDGAPLKTYDASKVAAIRTVSNAKGGMTFTSPIDGGTNTLAHVSHHDATLSGLLTPRHVLNSLGTSTMTITSPGNTVSSRVKQTVTDLVLAQRRGANPYPLSGSIRSEVFEGNATSPTSTMTMTFNGTSIVALTMTFGGVTRECSMDLARAAIPPTCFGI